MCQSINMWFIFWSFILFSPQQVTTCASSPTARLVLGSLTPWWEDQRKKMNKALFPGNDKLFFRSFWKMNCATDFHETNYLCFRLCKDLFTKIGNDNDQDVKYSVEVRKYTELQSFTFKSQKKEISRNAIIAKMP